MKIVNVIIAFVLLVNCTDDLIQKGKRNLDLGDYQRAVYIFNKVVDRDPDCFDARLGLGKALLQQISVGTQRDELWIACLTNLEAARTLKPDTSIQKILSVAWHQRAVYLLECKDSSGALQSLLKSVEYDKTNAKPLNLAGILYFNKGDLDKAFTLFSLVTDLDTLSPSGYFNAGIVLWTQGDCPGSKRLWLDALVRFPENKDLLYWAALAEKTCSTSR
ncbi:MAG TPA: tetratricopeptide repeat protein [Chitinispirillaceae bacterium]|nr:tetratricopeptide repeat protein [Chitinispirillaceae bacterium]